MRIDLNVLFHPAKSVLSNVWAHTILRPASSAAVASPAAVKNSDTLVTISDAARQAASVNRTSASDSVDAAAGLRDFIRQYDFNSITPQQMATLGGELRKRGEISQDVACSFIGVEMDTFVAMDRNMPIDMIAHFKMMQEIPEDAALTDPTLNFAVAYRRDASQALANVISFANSNRPHV